MRRAQPYSESSGNIAVRDPLDRTFSEIFIQPDRDLPQGLFLRSYDKGRRHVCGSRIILDLRSTIDFKTEGSRQPKLEGIASDRGINFTALRVHVMYP